MKVLAKLVAGHEEWLMQRVLHYARERERTIYSSIPAGAWCSSISGLSTHLLAMLGPDDATSEQEPQDDPSSDPIAAFGVLEAETTPQERRAP